MLPVLFVVVPSYNEQSVLPIVSNLLLTKLLDLKKRSIISSKSRILFIDDGSTDNTWKIIKELSRTNEHFIGISLSRNRGHQSALLAGLMEALDKGCDITISIDCDGQDDINAFDEMIEKYKSGCDVVYGVRNDRSTDNFLKKFTAECFYRLLGFLGAKIIFNHADYRLLSSRFLEEFANYKEVNLFLRGLIPLVGFKSATVFYKRKKRIAGEGHYTLSKMLTLAIDGITSLSSRPLKLVTTVGLFASFVGFFGMIFGLIYNSFEGGIVSLVSFFFGVQLVCVGVLGEYIGKIYMEVKQRPRYIISERTENIASKITQRKTKRR